MVKKLLRIAGQITIFTLVISFTGACRPTQKSLPPSPLATSPVVPTVKSVETKPVSTPTRPVNTPIPEGWNPLTGLPVANPALLHRNPVMIKISNFPITGRPHAGLSFADLVFEYYIGEYFNRFLAVFYGQDTPMAGPIRSGRLVDAQLASMFDGILVYGNADERVDNRLEEVLGERALAYKESPCPPVCGDETHSVTGVFAESAGITSLLEKKGVKDARPRLGGWLFNNTPPQKALPADFLSVQYATFNRGEWRYDATSGKYLRWIEESDQQKNVTMIPLTDRVNGTQLSFSNILVLFAFYIQYNETLHDISFWNNTTGQRAILFRDGVAQEGAWKAPQKDGPFVILNPQGTPLQFKPGNTWVVILGLSSTIRQSEPGKWDALFFLP